MNPELEYAVMSLERGGGGGEVGDQHQASGDRVGSGESSTSSPSSDIDDADEDDGEPHEDNTSRREQDVEAEDECDVDDDEEDDDEDQDEEDDDEECQNDSVRHANLPGLSSHSLVRPIPTSAVAISPYAQNCLAASQMAQLIAASSSAAARKSSIFENMGDF